MKQAFTWADLGWSPDLEARMPEGAGLRPARVASVYAARVDLWTPEGPRLASLRSRALRSATTLGGIAVGDWVAVAPAGADTDEVVVEAVLPRRTVLMRQAAGDRSEPQAIASNVDRVFIVTAVDGTPEEGEVLGRGAARQGQDFNVRRLERYLIAVAAGGAEAQIVLAKADRLRDPGSWLAEAAALAPAFATSAKTGQGIDELRSRIPPGTTATLVGSSGVGKSALVNVLLGRAAQLEGAVRAYDGRGRHTTTRRQLFTVPGGGLLIDTPGMRELKPWLPEPAEIADAFEDVVAVAEACRYRDCRHAEEPGCAVRAALDAGTLESARVASWQKLRREQRELSPRQTTFPSSFEHKRRARAMSVALRRRIRDKS